MKSFLQKPEAIEKIIEEMLKAGKVEARTRGARKGALVALVVTGANVYPGAISLEKGVNEIISNPRALLDFSGFEIRSVALKALETVFTNAFAADEPSFEPKGVRAFRESCWDSPVSCISDDAVPFRLIAAATSDLSGGKNFDIAHEVTSIGWSEAHRQKDLFNPEGLIYRSDGPCQHG